jgi:hypothetical protein
MQINIYQNYFLKNQINRLDKSFIPYFNTSSDPMLYEFGPISDLYESNKFKDADYIGLVSYKFNRKTRISGDDFKNFILQNPGYDVYFINPHPQLAYFYFNMWEQGEYWHSGLKEIASEVLNKLNLIKNVEQVPRQDHNSLCYSNFWVGNSKFWGKFGEIISKLKQLIYADKKLNQKLFEMTFHHNEYTSPFFPFFFERLFSTFILLNKDIKYLAYPYSKDEIINSCFFDDEKEYLLNIFEKKINFENLKKISYNHHAMSKNYFKNDGMPEILL